MEMTFLTTDEVAAALRVERRTVQLKIRNKELAAVNVGSDKKPTWRVSEEELDRYITSRTQEAA